MRPFWRIRAQLSLLARAHVNTVVVALAAKLAWIVCAVLRSGQRFEMKAGAMP